MGSRTDQSSKTPHPEGCRYLNIMLNGNKNPALSIFFHKKYKALKSGVMEAHSIVGKVRKRDNKT